MNLNVRRSAKIMANESIATQIDGFGERLEGLFKIIVDEINSGALKHPRDFENNVILLRISEAIEERLGIKVKFITNTELAAIMPFYSNKNHIFLNDFFRGNFDLHDQNKVLKEIAGKKGTVNLEEARVGGIFSEYVHPLYLNIYQLVQSFKMTPSMLTGILLHELGHAFYACYYSDRTDENNQVLASIARHLMNREKGDIEYVYREVSKFYKDVTKEDADKIVNGPRIVAGAVWFKIAVGSVKSLYGEKTYNQTAFEQRADNFASRFGYGKALTLALDNLPVEIFARSTSAAVFIALYNSLAFIATFMLAASMFFVGAIGHAIVLGCMWIVFLNLSREDVRDHTYDNLSVRYKRIRHDIIDQLKNPDLPNSKVRELIDMISVSDAAISGVKNYKSLPEVLANFVFSGSRNASQAINQQQLIEALSNNDLFVKAAEIKTL